MMKYIHSIACSMLLILLFSCERIIDWDTEEMPVMLVVEGSFSNEIKKHQVHLSLSADYFYNKPVPTVSGAHVTISDGVDTFVLREHADVAGLYETDSVAGIPGHRYTLDIILSEPVNSATHYFASEEMVRGMEIDSLIASIYPNPIYSSGLDMDSLSLILVILGQEPKEIQNYYQLRLFKNDSLLNDTIDEYTIVSDAEAMSGDYVNSILFFTMYHEGDRVGFEISSVSREYYDFITGVQNIANQSFDPFNMSGPPANAPGNIKGAEAIGYFKVEYMARGQAIAGLPPDE